MGGRQIAKAAESQDLIKEEWLSMPPIIKFYPETDTILWEVQGHHDHCLRCEPAIYQIVGRNKDHVMDMVCTGIDCKQ